MQQTLAGADLMIGSSSAGTGTLTVRGGAVFNAATGNGDKTINATGILDVGGDFPARLERALVSGEGLVAAFQFRVKGLDQHEAAETHHQR